MGSGKGKTRRTRSVAVPTEDVEHDWVAISQQDEYWKSKNGEEKEIEEMDPAYRENCANIFLREHASQMYYEELNILRKIQEDGRGANGSATVRREIHRLEGFSPHDWAETLPLMLALRGNKPPKPLPRPKFGRVDF